jgi:hypothetical protein
MQIQDKIDISINILMITLVVFLLTFGERNSLWWLNGLVLVIWIAVLSLNMYRLGRERGIREAVDSMRARSATC